MKGAVRIAALAVIGLALAGGMWLASRATSADRRNADALITVGGDLVHDALHPMIDLTRMSDAEETSLGTAIDAQVRSGMPVGGDAAAETYLSALLDRVAAGRSRAGIGYRIALVASPDINAFAVAGGRLYVTEGMLRFAGSEAELAAVIGHEICHVDRRHCVERMQLERAAGKVVPDLAPLARLGYEIALRGFSEEQELEADRCGALLAGRASYDPWASAELFARLVQARPEPGRTPTRNPVVEAAAVIPEALRRYLATHPPAGQRIDAVRRALVAEPDLWRGVRRYTGRGNLADRRSMSAEARPGEWIVRVSAPF